MVANSGNDDDASIPKDITGIGFSVEVTAVLSQIQIKRNSGQDPSYDIKTLVEHLFAIGTRDTAAGTIGLVVAARLIHPLELAGIDGSNEILELLPDHLKTNSHIEFGLHAVVKLKAIGQIVDTAFKESDLQTMMRKLRVGGKLIRRVEGEVEPPNPIGIREDLLQGIGVRLASSDMSIWASSLTSGEKIDLGMRIITDNAWDENVDAALALVMENDPEILNTLKKRLELKERFGKNTTEILNGLIADDRNEVLDILMNAFTEDPNVLINFETGIPGIGNGIAFYKEFGEKTETGEPIYRLLVSTGYGQIIIDSTVEETLNLMLKAVEERTSGRYSGQSPMTHTLMYEGQIKELIDAIRKANPALGPEGERPMSHKYGIPGISDPINGAHLRSASPVELKLRIGYGVGSLQREQVR